MSSADGIDLDTDSLIYAYEAPPLQQVLVPLDDPTPEWVRGSILISVWDQPEGHCACQMLALLALVFATALLCQCRTRRPPVLVVDPAPSSTAAKTEDQIHV